MKGSELRSMREEAGLSVRGAAAFWGRAPSSIYRWEHDTGGVIPSDLADDVRRLIERKRAGEDVKAEIAAVLGSAKADADEEAVAIVA